MPNATGLLEISLSLSFQILVEPYFPVTQKIFYQTSKAISIEFCPKATGPWPCTKTIEVDPRTEVTSEASWIPL